MQIYVKNYQFEIYLTNELHIKLKYFPLKEIVSESLKTPKRHSYLKIKKSMTYV